MINYIKLVLPFIALVIIFTPATVRAQEEDDPLRAFLERVQNNQQGQESEQPRAPALPQVDTQPRAPGYTVNADQETLDPLGGVSAPEEGAPPSRESIQNKIREQAFNAALTGLLPMQPDEIRKLMEAYDKTRQAVEVPIYPYPEPEIAVATASLDPGSLPLVIKVAPDHVTTVNILDSTGAPWPIEDLSWAGNFEILQPEEGSNIFRITPLSNFTYGNLSMRLVELNTPLTFTLKSMRDSVYYRLDVRVPEFGPYADIPLIDGGITLAAGDSTISAFLDGAIPEKAEKLTVSGVDGRTRAYKYKSKTYVRTPLTLLSPGWSGSVSSADGMNVYVVANAPVILLSDKGRVVRAHLKENDGDTYE